MKKSFLMSSMFVAAALVSQSALAEFKVRAGEARTSYELSGDYTAAKSDYTPVNVGFTYAYDDGLYFDLARSSRSGKHDGWARFGAPSEDFKRQDAALVTGMSYFHPDSGNAEIYYFGWKSGQTTLGAQNVGLRWTEEKFEASGWVFGGGGSFPIASRSAGAVGVNVGLGAMRAKWSNNAGFDVESDIAYGFSLGVSYTFPITSSFGIVADYKYNSYKYNFGGAATSSFIVEEKISALGASLYAKF